MSIIERIGKVDLREEKRISVLSGSKCNIFISGDYSELSSLDLVKQTFV